jgi:hypothetical protein
MATGTQPQTVWALLVRDLAETWRHAWLGKAPGKAKTSAPWIPILWKASPGHNLLKEQPGLHKLGPCTTGPPGCTGPPGPWPSGPLGPLPCRPARLPLHHASALQAHWAPAPPDCCPSAYQATAHLLAHRPTRPLPLRPTRPLPSRPARLQPTTGGLQHHEMLALNLPRRHRQTGLDAKGVTPEQQNN